MVIGYFVIGNNFMYMLKFKVIFGGVYDDVKVFICVKFFVDECLENVFQYVDYCRVIYIFFGFKV